MWAASKGRTAVVESLLARGVQVNCVNKVGQQMLGLHFLYLGICIFWSLGGIRRAWGGGNVLQCPCSLVASSVVEGVVDPCGGDTRVGQSDGLLLVP